MVQQVLKFGAAIGLLVSGAGASSCLSTQNEFGSRIIGGSTPVLVSSDPVEAAPGASVVLIGTGFSVAAAENIVSFGGSPSPASEYAIDGDGNQVLTVDIPADAPEGLQPLFIIVDGAPSNSLDFTVTP